MPVRSPAAISAILSLLALAACSSGGGGGGEGDGGEVIDTSLGTGAGTGNGGPLFASAGGWHPEAFSDATMPDLDPQLLVVSYLGGAGEQCLRGIRFEADGTVVAEGDGFSVSYAPDGGGVWQGTVAGDIASDDPGSFTSLDRPPLGTREVLDQRHDLTYSVGYRQVAGDLQQAFLRCRREGTATWTFWDWAASAAKDRSLTADSRGYDVWPMPDGDIGIKCWCDGGNTTLNRHPRSLDTGNAADDGAWQNGANSMSTYVLRADPLSGKPISGTFLRIHATWHAMDAWGRLYLPRAVGKILPTVDPANPFGHSSSAGTGLFVLEPDLKRKAFNARLGGTPSGVAGTTQAFAAIALRDDILVLAGATTATDLPCTGNAVQTSHGGGDHDGWLVILRLWPVSSG